jgi:hypothetical protein
LTTTKEDLTEGWRKLCEELHNLYYSTNKPVIRVTERRDDKSYKIAVPKLDGKIPFGRVTRRYEENMVSVSVYKLIHISRNRVS